MGAQPLPLGFTSLGGPSSPSAGSSRSHLLAARPCELPSLYNRHLQVGHGIFVFPSAQPPQLGTPQAQGTVAPLLSHSGRPSPAMAARIHIAEQHLCSSFLPPMLTDAMEPNPSSPSLIQRSGLRSLSPPSVWRHQTGLLSSSPKPQRSALWPLTPRSSPLCSTQPALPLHQAALQVVASSVARGLAQVCLWSLPSPTELLFCSRPFALSPWSCAASSISQRSRLLDGMLQREVAMDPLCVAPSACSM
jgi:hypothetical protein